MPKDCFYVPSHHLIAANLMEVRKGLTISSDMVMSQEVWGS